jgi:Protein of unknown function (DUF1569)
MCASAIVNTAKVTGRRQLSFQSYDELLSELDRLGSGPVRQLGNWSPGQNFRHLATVYNNSIDGFTLKFGLPLRVVGRLFRKRLLSMSMPAGFKLPARTGKALMPAATSTEEGLAELRAAIARLQIEPRRAPHPLFSDMTNEEWDRIHLKHAALHLSFLVPS